MTKKRNYGKTFFLLKFILVLVMKIFYNLTSPNATISEKIAKRGTAQWRYGARHIALAIQNHHPLSLFDKIQHLVLGFLSAFLW